MISQEIRNKTAENHNRLEQSNLLLPFSEGKLTREKYSMILQAFYGFFLPLESELLRIPLAAYLPDLNTRRKAIILENDLKILMGNNYQRPQLCQNLPDITTISQAMGCLYVMEGSTLGGKIIYKRIQQELGLDSSSGASFFYGYGPETGSKWKIFQQALTDFSAKYHTDQEIIEAANETFATFKTWLDQHIVHTTYYK